MGPVDPYAKNVAYNPKFDDLYSPMVCYLTFLLNYFSNDSLWSILI